MRLHPLPAARAPPRSGAPTTPTSSAGRSSPLSHAPLEHSGLDVRWAGRRGRAARALRGRRAAAAGGAAPSGSCARPGSRPRSSRTTTSSGQRQRDAPARERPEGAVVRVSALPDARSRDLIARGRGRGRLARRAARRSGSRGCGCPRRRPTQVESLRRAAAPVALRRARPAGRARAWTPWGPVDPAVLALMRRVKERFDPAGVLQPRRVRGRPVSGYDDDPRPAARADRRLRPLRLLPAHLPHLHALGRGDGLAARAHRADEGGPRARSRRRSSSTSTAASAAWRA